MRFTNYGDSNDVIPKNWIGVRQSKVKKTEWPPKNAAKLAARRADIEDDWTSYSFVPLCHSSES